jgi:DNA-binding XRE family transcriptional regulator
MGGWLATVNNIQLTSIARRVIVPFAMLTPLQLRELRRAPGAPNRLRKAMQLAEVTQVQLAEAIGTVQPNIAQIAAGNYSRLPLETARNISTHFGCAIEDIFPSPAEAQAS